MNREGELELETDEGERLAGKMVANRLLEDWDLDVDQYRRRADLPPGRDRARPRLVHKILFSMPPGTPPKEVLEAVTNFAREEFGLQHRYAMALHTDEPHPHVHLVVKAVSEQGLRLNIRKEMLRSWRAKFANHLRELGVAANATERAVRGENRPPLRDSIYRAGRRGDSRVLNGRLVSGAPAVQAPVGSRRLRATRELVSRGWNRAEALLRASGRADLAAQVATFVRRIPVPRSASELSIDELVQRRCARSVELPPTRWTQVTSRPEGGRSSSH